MDGWVSANGPINQRALKRRHLLITLMIRTVSMTSPLSLPRPTYLLLCLLWRGGGSSCLFTVRLGSGDEWPPVPLKMRAWGSSASLQQTAESHSAKLKGHTWRLLLSVTKGHLNTGYEGITVLKQALEPQMMILVLLWNDYGGIKRCFSNFVACELFNWSSAFLQSLIEACVMEGSSHRRISLYRLFH